MTLVRLSVPAHSGQTAAVVAVGIMTVSLYKTKASQSERPSGLRVGCVQVERQRPKRKCPKASQGFFGRRRARFNSVNGFIARHYPSAGQIVIM
jgi:hypothetical protein